jgi:hypothetical protein
VVFPANEGGVFTLSTRGAVVIGLSFRTTLSRAPTSRPTEGGPRRARLSYTQHRSPEIGLRLGAALPGTPHTVVKRPDVRSDFVIEIMRFRLGDGVDEDEFLLADRRLQVEFAYHQPGLSRRTTARSRAGNWIVIDLWETPDAADACAKRWDHDPVVQAFMALLDKDSVQNERYFDLGG